MLQQALTTTNFIVGTVDLGVAGAYNTYMNSREQYKPKVRYEDIVRTIRLLDSSISIGRCILQHCPVDFVCAPLLLVDDDHVWEVAHKYLDITFISTEA